MTVPRMDQIAEMSFRGKVLYEATLTVLALRRYKQVTGQYPEKLDDLVSGGYLKAIPKDPYSTGPLVYRKTQDDFILYSIAGDFKDDGGKPIPQTHWNAGWGGGVGGDRVFWPVQVEETAAAQE